MKTNAKTHFSRLAYYSLLEIAFPLYMTRNVRCLIIAIALTHCVRI